MNSMNKVTFGNGILAAEGEQHRRQRKMLNPVFSVNHLKRMGKPQVKMRYTVTLIAFTSLKSQYLIASHIGYVGGY